MINLKSITEKLKFEYKGRNIKLIIFALIGLGLMLFPKSMGEPKEEKIEYVSNEAISNDDYIENEEKRIEEFISKFSEVTKVKVLLSLSNGKEKILAKEFKETRNQDNESDTNNIKKASTYEETTVYKNDDNPYVLRENEPSLRGIVILIDGNVTLKLITDIKDAMKAYLDLPTNKVQVYKMKG